MSLTGPRDWQDIFALRVVGIAGRRDQQPELLLSLSLTRCVACSFLVPRFALCCAWPQDAGVVLVATRTRVIKVGGIES